MKELECMIMQLCNWVQMLTLAQVSDDLLKKVAIKVAIRPKKKQK